MKPNYFTIHKNKKAKKAKYSKPYTKKQYNYMFSLHNFFNEKTQELNRIFKSRNL